MFWNPYFFRPSLLAGGAFWITAVASSQAWAQAPDPACSECVQASDIAAGAIATPKLVTASVVASKIAADAVRSTNIITAAVASAKITSLGGDVDDAAIDLSNGVDATIYSSVVAGSDHSIRSDGFSGSALVAYSRVNGNTEHADCAFLTSFTGVPYATPSTCP